MQWVQPDFNCFICPTAINQSLYILQQHKLPRQSHFFIVFTPPYMRTLEYERPDGYDPVFFLPSEQLVRPQWEVILYEMGGEHGPVAGIKCGAES